jgi:molybdopterin-synthase adenylyltransferase
MRLIFASPELQLLSAALLERSDVETCGVGLARAAGERLLVGSFEFPTGEAYAERTSTRAVLRPEFLFDITERARRQNLSLVFAHSHPFDRSIPAFSPLDDAGEMRLASFLEQRSKQRIHGALVISPGGMSARQLGANIAARVIEVGASANVLGAIDSIGEAAQFDRQVRAFGTDGQERISSLKVAIVGAGGTGSIIAQQLAYLGVRDFTVVDFDKVEETNLNRLVGATASDVGQPKVDIARRSILAANANARVETILGDVADQLVAARLTECDVIFSCTDSHASRAIVGQLAYQYLIPTIDMGVSISVRGGKLTHITGRVQLLAPGLPCLTCMDLLNSEEIRRELLTPEARKADPYIVGFHEPQPSVISLNGTVASLAVSMFLGMVTGAPFEARLQIYDGINGTIRPTSASRDEACYVCSSRGALGRGDSWPLPTRQAAS